MHPAASLAEPAPPRTSFSPTPGPADAGLPVHLTGFVGRGRELARVAELLAATRLLTLTGAGGSGKTRLAREAASAAVGQDAAGRDGEPRLRLAWVDLAGIGDPALVPTQVAAALGAPGRPGAAALEAAREALGDGPALVVLDNCEHVVDAAAAAAAALLRGCPGLRLLATSREALGVPGETAWLVPALAPDEARQLFVERARSADAGFAVTAANAEAVAEICRRLDGLPLAIELAAARVRALTPAQIAARLDDAFRLLVTGDRTAPPRHRTLRATIEWSHALLGERERMLLRRLAVFAGGFTLEAAEAVCAGAAAPGGGGPVLDPADVLDGVAALVDRSLVVMDAGAGGEPRYRLLEAVRQYGRERLAEAGEVAAAEAAHGRYFLAAVEAALPALAGGETEPGLVARLAADHDNLRAAMAWTLREGAPPHAAEHAADPAEALRLAAALYWYWYGAATVFGRGQYREAAEFVARAIARGRAAGSQNADSTLLSAAVMAQGLIAFSIGAFDGARAAFAEAAALASPPTPPWRRAFALAYLGAARLMLGDADGAWDAVESAGALLRPHPTHLVQSAVDGWAVEVAMARGDLATARTRAAANLANARATGHRIHLGFAHTFVGRVALAEGRVDDAAAAFGEALAHLLALGDGWPRALALDGLAVVAHRRGRHAEAARLLGVTDALRARLHLAEPATDRDDRARVAAAAREALGPGFDDAYAHGRAASPDALVAQPGGPERAPPSGAPPGAAAAGAAAPNAAAPNAAAPAQATPPAASPPAAAPALAPLRVRALGALEVWAGDRPVDPGAWGLARARELFAYLVSHPEGRTKGQVGLALWPDASSAQVHNSFHVTLHRLRRVLGGAAYVRLAGDRYQVDPALVAEFDAAAFAREANAARAALAAAPTPEAAAAAAEALERAAARYRGDFLDGEPAGDWHLEFRAPLQRLYVEALLAVGGHHAGAGRPARAAEAYRRVLTRDPLHEAAAAGLMRAHEAMGERAQALRAYAQFAERVRAETGADPAGPAAALHARLRAAARGDA